MRAFLTSPYPDKRSPFPSNSSCSKHLSIRHPYICVPSLRYAGECARSRSHAQLLFMSRWRWAYVIYRSEPPTKSPERFLRATSRIALARSHWQTADQHSPFFGRGTQPLHHQQNSYACWPLLVQVLYRPPGPATGITTVKSQQPFSSTHALELNLNRRIIKWPIPPSDTPLRISSAPGRQASTPGIVFNINPPR